MIESLSCPEPPDETWDAWREGASNDASPGERKSPLLPADQRFTDAGNARRLIRDYGASLRWVTTWGSWVIWDGTRWRRDTKGEVVQRAKQVASALWEEAAVGAGPDERKRAGKWAMQSESVQRIEAMIRLARTEPGVPVEATELDTHAWLLNTPSGTVDLRTGTVRSHAREELHTKSTGVTLDRNCPTPRWNAFLAQIIPDVEVRAFVQRAAGYAATGDCGEHVFFLLHGGGQNGKTTFLNVMQAVLGDYADQAAPDLLLAKRHQSHPTEVAELIGKRFVSATEARTGCRLDDALTKRITGGDPLRGRFMRQDFFTFTPTHKLWLAVNALPRVDDPSHAMWRRIKRIPFEVQIPREQRVQNLDRILVEKEGPGILAWVVEGAAAWVAGGLNTPLEVEVATESYRVEEDHVAQFFEDRLVFDINFKAPSAALRSEYEDWAKDAGIDERRLVNANVLGERLTERGARPTKLKTAGKQSRGWRGVGIANEPIRV